MDTRTYTYAHLSLSVSLSLSLGVVFAEAEHVRDIKVYEDIHHTHTTTTTTTTTTTNRADIQLLFLFTNIIPAPLYPPARTSSPLPLLRRSPIFLPRLLTVISKRVMDGEDEVTRRRTFPRSVPPRSVLRVEASGAGCLVVS